MTIFIVTAFLVTAFLVTTGLVDLLTAEINLINELENVRIWFWPIRKLRKFCLIKELLRKFARLEVDLLHVCLCL